MPEPEPLSHSIVNLQHPELEHILYYPSLDSTNLEARRQRKLNPDKNLLIVASEQTAGLGQQGRKWSSAYAKGIWMSFLIQAPQVASFSLNLLSLYVGIVVQKVLQPYLEPPVLLKWPNDVLVNDRKMCGILTEVQWSGDTATSVIIGIGINVSHQEQDFPPELRHLATSITREGHGEADRISIIRSITNELFSGLRAPLTAEQIRLAWNDVAWQMNEDIGYMKTDQEYRGRFLGINQSGQALIETKAGVQAYLTGEIRLKQLFI